METPSTTRRNPVVNYLLGAKEELKHVTWPSWEQVKKSTQTVIVVSILFAIFLGVLDYIFSLGLKAII